MQTMDQGTGVIKVDENGYSKLVMLIDSQNNFLQPDDLGWLAIKEKWFWWDGQTLTERKLPLWHEQAIRWKHEVVDQKGNIIASVEIHKSIFDDPEFLLRGYEENVPFGTWQNVARTIDAAKRSFRHAPEGRLKVGVNIRLNPDGSITPLDQDPSKPYSNTVIEFDPGAPIRFIYVDNREYAMPYPGSIMGHLVIKLFRGFSYGWGVDDQTQGLVVVLGVWNRYAVENQSSWIINSLYPILGVADYYRVYNTGTHQNILNLWQGKDKKEPIRPIIRELKGIVEPIPFFQTKWFIGDEWLITQKGFVTNGFLFGNLYRILESDTNKPLSPGLDEEDGAFAWLTNKYKQRDKIFIIGTQWDTTQEADEFIVAFMAHMRAHFPEPVERGEYKIAWQLDESRYLALHVYESSAAWIFTPDPATEVKIWELLEQAGNVTTD